MGEDALRGAGIVPLAKTLLLDTDEAEEICGDLEGANPIGPGEMLLVNDNDFGVEGVETQFLRVSFDRPIGWGLWTRQSVSIQPGPSLSSDPVGHCSGV